MTHGKKQITIAKVFKTRATRLSETKAYDGLLEELQQLQQELQEKQDELFQMQRSYFKQRYARMTDRQASLANKKSEPYIRPEKIVLSNSVETLKKNMELMSVLTGMEVQSYQSDDHCTIVYHMQHDYEHQVKHGLKIDIKTGQNIVSGSSLPLGFNLSAVIDCYENLMLPECLVAVRVALLAYYKRLEQIDNLKNLLKLEAQIFKTLDGSHIEIKFTVRNELDSEDEPICVTLMLDYRVSEIRPKQWSFVETEMPDSLLEALEQQCLVFKRKPLDKAFREAFMDGVSPYVLVKQIGVSTFQKRRTIKRSRPANPYNANDDTFHPEDCSSGDDAEE